MPGARLSDMKNSDCAKLRIEIGNRYCTEPMAVYSHRSPCTANVMEVGIVV